MAASYSGYGANGPPCKKLKNSYFAPNFPTIVETDSYVDKSLLVHKLFHQEEGTSTGVSKIGVLITAPKHFGKSINMEMIKCFLEIQENEQHNKAGQEIPVNQRSNFKLFKDLKIMAPEYRDFVNEHFGQYPVIKINFQCPNVIGNFKDIVHFCKEKIHKTFVQHSYLKDSPSLSEKQQSICARWFYDPEFRYLSARDAQVALELLRKYLCIHFRKPKLFVLVDDYDSPILKLVHDTELNPIVRCQIIEFYTAVLSALLKDTPLLFGAVVTGLSYAALDVLCHKFRNLTVHRFLNDSYFAEYYGFSDDDVDFVLSKFGVHADEIPIVKDTFVYKSKDGQHVMYNPYFIMKYLSFKETGESYLVIGEKWY